MSNNRAFTSDFVSGLREQRDPYAAWKKRRARTINAMSHIRMYVSPWFLDADGLMTRHVYQLERRHIRPAVTVGSFSDADDGVTAGQIKNAPVNV
jgi:hypothetical protein